jgi:hypothetical protein
VTAGRPGRPSHCQEERSLRCHLCVSAERIAEQWPFLVCRPLVGQLEVTLTLASIFLPGITYLRKAQYDVVPLKLNLCASCARAHRDEITKELCLENPLVELLERFGGFTEVRWPIELDDDQRADGGPPRLGVGARVLTPAGLGVIRLVTPVGRAVIDLDVGGTVTQDLSQIVADRPPG